MAMVPSDIPWKWFGIVLGILILLTMSASAYGNFGKVMNVFRKVRRNSKQVLTSKAMREQNMA